MCGCYLYYRGWYQEVYNTVIIAGYRNVCGCIVLQRLVPGSIQYCNNSRVPECVWLYFMTEVSTRSIQYCNNSRVPEWLWLYCMTEVGTRKYTIL